MFRLHAKQYLTPNFPNGQRIVVSISEWFTGQHSSSIKHVFQTSTFSVADQKTIIWCHIKNMQIFPPIGHVYLVSPIWHVYFRQIFFYPSGRLIFTHRSIYIFRQVFHPSGMYIFRKISPPIAHVFNLTHTTCMPFFPFNAKGVHCLAILMSCNFASSIWPPANIHHVFALVCNGVQTFWPTG